MLNPHLNVDDVLDRIDDIDFEAVILGCTSRETLLRCLSTALEYMILYPVPDIGSMRRIEIIDTVMSTDKTHTLKEILYRLIVGEDCRQNAESLSATRDRISAFLDDFARARHYRVAFHEDSAKLHLQYGELDFLNDHDHDGTVVSFRQRAAASDGAVPVAMVGNVMGLHDSELVMRIWLNELSLTVPDRYSKMVKDRRGSVTVGCRHLHRLPVTDLQLSALRAQWFDDIIQGRSQTSLTPRRMEQTHTIDIATVERYLSDSRRKPPN